MAKIDSHPWVKPYIAEHRQLKKDSGRLITDTLEGIALNDYHKGRVHAARKLAREYGQGHNMSAHGEGKKHGEK